MRVSIVIIGKNSAHLLRKNYVNRDYSELDFADEIIYIDSASTDDTISVLKELNWGYYVLSSASRLSAAAGRYVGTLKAKGDYILYLDADMVLNLLNNISIKELLDKHITSDIISGFGGVTIDIINEVKNKKIKREKDGEVANNYGGFVLLNRKDVLEAGNWNPNVIANEENELYARLIKLNKSVKISREMECFHYTDRPPTLLKKFLNLYFPFSKRSRFFYGASGLALHSAIKNGSWSIYLRRFNSESISFLVLLILYILICFFIPVGVVFKLFIALAFVLIMLLIIRKKRSLLFFFVCPSEIIQMIYGYFKYNEKEVIIEKE